MNKTVLKKQIDLLLAQEALLQFDSFSNEDAWTLGCMLVARAKKAGVAPAFEITVNGYTVFRYGFAGTNQHNTHWLNRKRNTVTVTGTSSLRAGLQLGLADEDPERDWHLSTQDYAFLGGGFPLTLRRTGIVGAICCSGLPHEKDHAMVVETVAEFLGVALPETPVINESEGDTL